MIVREKSLTKKISANLLAEFGIYFRFFFTFNLYFHNEFTL